MADANIIASINRLISPDSPASATLSADTVDAIIERYPYFALPAAMALRDNATDIPADLRRKFLRHLARSASSPVVLSTLLNEDDTPFYPEEKAATPSTVNAIDTFLSTYGNGGEDDEVLNRLIFNPTPDYAQLLAQEEQQNLPSLDNNSGDSHDDLLNRFILRQKQQEGSAPQDKPERIPAATVENRHSDDAVAQPADSSLLSESLAKIFIRQHQYERAFEILSQLSLNYPEKSVYFADQMRFLRKVINNRRHNSAPNKA